MQSAVSMLKFHEILHVSKRSLAFSGYCENINMLKKLARIAQGSYRQVRVKFKDFSRTSKILSNSFQGLNVNEKYYLSVKILLQKC